MADFLCTAGANALLDYEFGLTVPTWPTYLGLCLAPATKAGLLKDAAGTVAEVSGGSYARVLVTRNLVNWKSAINSQMPNLAAFNFAQPTASWGLILSAFLADAVTGGNVWWHWDLVTPWQIGLGSYAPGFPAGNLLILGN